MTTQSVDRQLVQRHLSHAEWLVSKGKANEAERESKEVLRHHPSSYLAHNDLGAIYISQNKFGQACRKFGQAVALNPSLASIQENLGICLLKSGEVARAVLPLERASRLDPRDLRAHYLLGYCFLQLEQLDQAQAELQYVRKHKPGDETTLFYLIRIYEKKRDEKDAERTFRQLAKLHPHSVFVHTLLGESYDLQNRPSQAIREFSQALAIVWIPGQGGRDSEMIPVSIPK
jgi:Flp pilus assembly protein TadD